MRASRLVLVLAVAVSAAASPVPALAQHAGHSQHVGKEVRDIKALAPERVEELLAGDGAGYALAAELNRYPGPRHVLDLAAELELTAEQVAAVEEVFRGMQARARELGARLVAAERALDEAFRGGAIAQDELERLVAAAAGLDGELRGVHLEAHLRTRELMSAAQVERYHVLRGYGTG